MNNRLTRDWGSIADWVQVFALGLLPVVTLLLSSLLGTWLDESSPWLGAIATALTIGISLTTVLLVSLARSVSFKTVFSTISARVLAASPIGSLTRLVISIGLGVIALLILYPIGLRMENWWIPITAMTISWLTLTVVTSNARLREVQSEYAALQDVAATLTGLETRLFSYPDCVSEPIWEYDFADFLDSPDHVTEKSGPDVHVEIASCEGIKRRSIYQHPGHDGRTDAILHFALQPTGVVNHLVLTFYTGIRDSSEESNGTIKKSGFRPNTGNRVQFQISVNGHRVFQEIRESFEWRFHALVLPPPVQHPYEIEFRTNALGKPHFNWSVWGEPRLAEWSVVFKDLARLQDASGDTAADVGDNSHH